MLGMSTPVPLSPNLSIGAESSTRAASTPAGADQAPAAFGEVFSQAFDAQQPERQDSAAPSQVQTSDDQSSQSTEQTKAPDEAAQAKPSGPSSPESAPAAQPGPEVAAPLAAESAPAGPVMQAPAAPDVDQSLSGLQLKAVMIGRETTLLVADTPLTDESLAAYAKSSGLDERALSELMALPHTPLASEGVLTSNNSVSALLAAARATAMARVSSSEAVSQGQTPVQASAQVGQTSISQDTLTNIALASKIRMTPLDSGQATSAVGASESLPAAHVLSMRFAIQSPKTAALLDERLGALSKGARLGKGGERVPTLPPIDLRSGVVPAGGPDLGRLGAEQSALDDGSGVRAFAEDSPSARPSDSSQPQASALASQGGSSSQSGADSSARGSGGQGGHAPQNGYQLAQRFGELMSQRLIQQISQGNWRCEMEVHPSELGKIQVDLDWRGGELEAVFRTSQALTKDMIQDNLPRLREVLERSGTDVAYLGVGADDRRKNGGQGAPEQQHQAHKNTASEPTPEVGSVSSGPRALSDGLDVLA